MSLENSLALAVNIMLKQAIARMNLSISLALDSVELTLSVL